MMEKIAKHLPAHLLAAAVFCMLMAGMSATARAQELATARNAPEQDPIVGTWLITVAAQEGAPSFTVVEVYSVGGTLAAIDNQAPSSLETPAIGSWIKVAPRKYFETQWQFLYNADGSFFGTWIGQIEDDLDPSATRMPTAPFTYQILDAHGNLIDSGSGQSTAVKMPPPQGPRP